MDGQRWWIIDEIARWWTQASEGERWMLMQRAIEGTKEASLLEVQLGAAYAEIEASREDIAAHECSKQFIEAWSAGKGVRRC